MLNEQTMPQFVELEAALNPRVINVMMELHDTYNLPIEIVCSNFIDGLRIVKLRTAGFDESVLQGFVNIANNLEILKRGGSLEEVYI